MMHALHEYQAKLYIIIKGEALISFLGEKKRKNTSEGKKEKKKKIVFPNALS